MADKNETVRLMDRAAEEILKPFQEPIHSIYIDSDFLYDYRLGALLLTVKNQQQYDYVKTHIADYVAGNSRKITKYFPELGVSETDLDALEQDVTFKKYVQVAAPKTEFLTDFGSFIAKVNTYNHSKEMTHPLQLVINQRKHVMPEMIWKQLKDYIFSIDPTVQIFKTNYESWNDVPDEVFQRWSMMLVHDLVDFMKVGAAPQKMLKASKGVDKVVLAPYQVEEDFDSVEQERNALENFEMIMSLMVHEFSFVRKSISLER